MNVEILGVNQIGAEAYNAYMTAGNALPWLQDVQAESVWSRWGVDYRDVRILDSESRLVATYNLTIHDLGIAQNREDLKALFLEAAQWVDTDHDGLPDDWERLKLGRLDGGPQDDPDGDGQSNLTEYAFGTDPLQAASQSIFQTRIVKNGADRFFEVTFRRRTGWAVDYGMEQSPDLVHWSDAAVTGPGLLTNLFDRTGTGQTSYVLAAPIDSASRTFVRVRAIPPAQSLPPASGW